MNMTYMENKHRQGQWRIYSTVSFKGMGTAKSYFLFEHLRLRWKDDYETRDQNVSFDFLVCTNNICFPILEQKTFSLAASFLGEQNYGNMWQVFAQVCVASIVQTWKKVFVLAF